MALQMSLMIDAASARNDTIIRQCNSRKLNAQILELNGLMK